MEPRPRTGTRSGNGAAAGTTDTVHDAVHDAAHSSTLRRLAGIGLAGYGPWVLTGIAAGFAAFSVHCLTRARHPVS